ncbi:unnamed protein product [Symbiodinium natans]|uniref:Microsomal glutathione S-transferase 3 n=1 Tax=Symbiodinium natans TaxID=878477 RepID=A0A812PGS6_9DINO|nr:unnamed protein product [Symbiodinium natans]
MLCAAWFSASCADAKTPKATKDTTEESEVELAQAPQSGPGLAAAPESVWLDTAASSTRRESDKGTTMAESQDELAEDRKYNYGLPGTEPPPPVPPAAAQAAAVMFLGFCIACLMSRAGLNGKVEACMGGAAAAQRAVALEVVALLYVNLMLASRTLHARHRHGVPLPYMYPHAPLRVSNSAAYMAVVRGHENFLETAPFALALLLLCGYHTQSAGMGALLGGIYVVGRVHYASGYARTPEGRLPGQISSVLSLVILAGEVVRHSMF